MDSNPPPGGAWSDDFRERRLHPLSWLFVMLTQLRHVALPLVVLLVVGRGGWPEFGSVVAAAALAAYAFVYSLGFRYRLGADQLFVREGLLGRTERHVPYARIQNIVERRNPLHRLFGVTELRLESAGGTEPEAVMNVITTAEAARIAAVLRGRVAAGDAAAHHAEQRIFGMSHAEIVRLGLLTNRGLVIVGALVALVFQFEPWEPAEYGRLVDLAQRAVREWTGATQAYVPLAVGIALTAAGAVIALKLLSVVMAFVTFYNFVLSRAGERISSATGLLTRSLASARRDRIQRILVRQTWLGRHAHRQRLWCEVAAGLQAVNEEDGARLRWLAPLADASTVSRIVDEVAPGLDPAAQRWLPLHPRARRRRFLRTAALVTGVPLLSIGPLGWWGLWLWPVLLPLAWAEASGWARFAAYACDGEVIAFRAGWLRHEWALTWVHKAHAVRLERSPFDRRHGMAAVMVDTAGAASTAMRLRVPYLPEADARALVARLRERIPYA